MIKRVCRGPPRVRSCPDPVETPEEDEVKSHPILLWVGLEEGAVWTRWDPWTLALWVREAMWCHCRQTSPTHTKQPSPSPKQSVHCVCSLGPACLFGFTLNSEDCFFKIINWKPRWSFLMLVRSWRQMALLWFWAPGVSWFLSLLLRDPNEIKWHKHHTLDQRCK